MAVVLPIHSHIDFSNPMENDYCHNEEEETGNENESSPSDMFTNRGESTNSDNDLADVDAQSDNSMDIGESSGECDDEKADTLPLNISAQNDSTSEEEEQTSNDSVDNNLSTDDEVPQKSSTPEDENSTFISCLMAVDDIVEPSETKLSNIVDAILMEETNDTTEDDMNLDLNCIPTFPAILLDEIHATKEDDGNNMAIGSPMSVLVEVVPEAEKTPSYGGLENLGNTCYMASAIQLLCGLDSFPTDLKSRIPPQPENSNKDDDDDTQSLRDALLDVMERLEKGETVRPDDLKRCIDSRTSLFLGYHQQDSHEFLTTLLDIIDEDYKIKTKPEETTEESANDSNDAENDENDERDESDDTNGKNSSEDLTRATNNDEELPISQECNDDENDGNSNDDASVQKSLLSPMKKQKTVEESPSEERVAAADAIASLHKSKSYSDFKFYDIESLLHDKEGKAEDSSSSSLTHSKSGSRLDEPKCKLAGGRMSTTGVELTRFGEKMDEDVQPTGVSLENATPQQQIVEDAADHDEMEDTEASTESCSPVSSNFTTKVRVCLTCESCKFRRSHIETYLHLSLDISTGSSNDDNADDNNDDNDVRNLGCPSSSSIEEGLRRFFAPEKRDIKCEKCFHTSALQTSEITQLPRNLLFHLKRFIVDVSPDYSSISYRKDQSSVVFDERMELEATQDSTKTYHPLHSLVHDDEERGFRDFLAPDCVYQQGQAYEIRSVVNHIGSSASCGHYTADAKRLTDDEDDESREWIRFNDSYVSSISKTEAVEDASKTAYMIMYELVQ